MVLWAHIGKLRPWLDKTEVGTRLQVHAEVNVETRIQVTPHHFVVVITEASDTSEIFILTVKNGKEKLDFYGEHTLRKIENWYEREYEAHMHTVEYAYRQIVREDNIGGKLLSGEYIPGGEVSRGYNVYL